MLKIILQVQCNFFIKNVFPVPRLVTEKFGALKILPLCQFGPSLSGSNASNHASENPSVVMTPKFNAIGPWSSPAKLLLINSFEHHLSIIFKV